MSVGGTQAYEGTADLPPAVISALGLARSQGFDCSCRPEQGRLLRLLAAGRRGGLIGETGAGCGVGLSWLLTGAVRRPAQRHGPLRGLVSIARRRAV